MEYLSCLIWEVLLCELRGRGKQQTQGIAHCAGQMEVILSR